MARPRSPQRPEPAALVRRPKGERKRLDPAFEALARGDETRLRPSGKQRPRLRDPRVIAMVPGVGNRDARAVYDARVDRLERAKASEYPASVSIELAEAVLLGLWRGRNLTGFEPFAEQVLGIGLEDAMALANAGAAMLEVPLERCRDSTVATWMRMEAALLEAGVNGRVTLRAGTPESLQLTIDADAAPTAAAVIARKLAPLSRDREIEHDEELARDRARRKPGGVDP